VAAETVTVLFTDMVGSTAQRQRLGDEAANAVLAEHDEIVRRAAESHGGRVVEGTGDGAMLAFLGAGEAVRAAVAIQQDVEQRNRRATERIELRIGLSLGDLSVGEDGVHGMAAHEAARVCALADADQILVTDVVRVVAGSRLDEYEVRAHGTHELKGFAVPVTVWSVQWLPLRTDESKLPGRLVGAASDAFFGFFGRTAELAVLGEARKRAQGSQRCQVVFVAGEAGIGKTALVAQASRAAVDEGALVLFGHADEDVGIAYQPWIEVVSRVVRECDRELVTGLRAAQRAALARLVPDIDSGGERVGDPDTERLLLWEGITELIAAASQHQSVMLVLDDLHWADTGSLQLLRHVIGSAASMNVTIAITYRDTDLTRGHPLTNLLADLHAQANVTRISLAGLEDVELIELMEAAAGHSLDDDGVGLAHALRRETDGNPFFSGEILRHLGESGQIIQGEDGRWTVAVGLEDVGLPTSVRDVVGRRVERLGDQALRTLRMAAVIGREFDIGLLATLADLDDDAVLDVMDAAAAAAVLTESDIHDRYRFTHALIQHALYDELSPARRQRAHQRIAETLETDAAENDPTIVAELARHWIAATRPAELEKALHYARRAGDLARDALAPEDAIRWYRQALDMLDRSNPPDLHQRAELLAILGAAQRQAGHHEYRDTLLGAADLAERLDDSACLIRAALGFSQGASLFGDEDAKRVAAAALERVTGGPTRARLLAAFSAAHDGTFDWQTRRDFALQALDEARNTDDATFVDVVRDAQLTIMTPDRLVVGVEDLERAAALADRLADPVLAADVRFHLVGARYMQCDLEGADSLIVEVEDLADRIGLSFHEWRAALLATGRMLLAGRPDAAESSNERALELGAAAGALDALAAHGALLLHVRWQQGRLDEIADFFIDVANDNPSIAALRGQLPELLTAMGRVDEARERLATEADNGFDFPYDHTWLAVMMTLLDAAATTRDIVAARMLIDRVAPYDTQVAVVSSAVVAGAAARPLARAATVVSDYDKAEKWFALADDTHAQLKAPYWTTRGQLDRTDLCLERRAHGDLERARGLATTAAATAADYGFGGLERRALKLLASI
jgi:class 3 adenylate cyclase/tetratricopeptide (TPR) repeat protein